MIKRKGDVFTTKALWIAHGCNTRGVMGAGIAKTVRDNYPAVHEAYVKQVLGGNFNPGDCYGVYQHNRVILNLATQDEPGANARYEWVFQSLMAAARRISANTNYWRKDAHKHNGRLVIAMPMIGAGIGGLEWDKVEALVNAVEVLVPEVEFEVWKYQ